MTTILLNDMLYYLISHMITAVIIDNRLVESVMFTLGSALMVAGSFPEEGAMGVSVHNNNSKQPSSSVSAVTMMKPGGNSSSGVGYAPNMIVVVEKDRTMNV